MPFRSMGLLPEIVSEAPTPLLFCSTTAAPPKGLGKGLLGCQYLGRAAARMPSGWLVVPILLAACAVDQGLGFSHVVAPAVATRSFHVFGRRGRLPLTFGEGSPPSLHTGKHTLPRTCTSQHIGALQMQQRRSSAVTREGGAPEVRGALGFNAAPGLAADRGCSRRATAGGRAGLSLKAASTEHDAAETKAGRQQGDEAWMDKNVTEEHPPDGGMFAGWVQGEVWPVLLLNFVAILWGTQHAIIKLSTVDDGSGSSPAAFNLARFLIASLVFLPLSPGLWRAESEEQEVHDEGDALVSDEHADERGLVEGLKDGLQGALDGPRGVWLAGAEMGLWMFAGYAAQTVGLQFTSAGRSAFLLYLNVKLVPLFSSIFYGTDIPRKTWAAAAVAVAGTVLLGYDGSPPNIGDAWSVAAATASAVFILRLGTYSTRFQAAELTATSMVSVTLLCLGWVLAIDHPTSMADLLPHSASGAAAALYLGLVTTALTNFLQTVGQKKVPAEQAAIIYSMDPVWGAGFAYLLLGETIGPQGGVGCALLLLATSINMLAKDDGGNVKA